MKSSRVATSSALILFGITALVAAAVLFVRDWDLHDELLLAWADES